MQAIIIQPEIQAAAVPTTSCSLIRRFTGGNALAKQSLTTYRLRCKAVDCCETLHHRIIDWQRMSMCTCWCCLIRFSCRRIRLADVVTTTSRLLGRNCHTMRMGTITLSSTGMGMGRHFTDGHIAPSVNYLLIVILEQLIAMVTIRTQSQWIEPIKRGMKQTLCGHIVKIYVALEVLQQAPMEAILIALQPTLQGVIRHITICNHTLLFIGGSVLVS